MKYFKKHHYKLWEISIIEVKNNKWKWFKVTRRIPEFGIAETRFFKYNNEAKKQFEEWLE